MTNNIKLFDIYLELEKFTHNDVFTIDQNDLDTIQLNIFLQRDGQTLDITGTTPRIVIRKPSGLSVIQDCEIVNTLTGSIKAILNTQSYVEAGIHEAEIYLYQNSTISVTGSFDYISKKSVLNDKTVQSTNEWQSMNEAFSKIDENFTQMNEDIERIENADVFTKGEVNISLAGKVDKISGKGLSTNDYDNTEKAEVAKVKDKADKTYVDIQLTDKASKDITNFISVKTYGVKQDGTDESSKIQDCLNNENLIFFPAGTYVAQALTINQSNTTILFHPKAVFKFPSNPTRASMFQIGDGLATSFIQNIKLLGSFTIDATGQPVGKLLRGVYVLGVRHFEINGVLGIGFPDGYTVHIAKSLGATTLIPERGEVRHVRCENGSWGAVAITSGRHLLVENASANVASEAIVDIELDGTGGNDFTENIIVNLVEAENTRAVKLTAHHGTINQVKMTNIRGVHTVTTTPATIQFSKESGSLSNIYIENLYVNGGQYGIYSPNDTIILDAFDVKNAVIENCSINATKMSGGVWYNCIAKNNAQYGFASGFHGAASGLVNGVVPNLKMTFINCQSYDNNVSNISSGSGFYFTQQAEILMRDCISYDTRGTKLQKYGAYVVQGVITTEGCNFEGNLTGAYMIYDAEPSVDGFIGSKAIPTGKFKAGVFVKNEDLKQLGSTGAKYLVLGWDRLTNGNTAVMGTDWQEVKFNTGN